MQRIRQSKPHHPFEKLYYYNVEKYYHEMYKICA